MILPRLTTVVAHVISWLLFFSLIISFDLTSRNQPQFTEFFSGSYLIFYATYLFIFYFNLAVLVPKLYLRRQYVPYIVAILLLLLGVYLTQPFDHIYNNKQSEPAFSSGRPDPRFEDHPPPQ